MFRGGATVAYLVTSAETPSGRLNHLASGSLMRQANRSTMQPINPTIQECETLALAYFYDACDAIDGLDPALAAHLLGISAEYSQRAIDAAKTA